MNVSPALIPAHCALLLETLLVQNANLDTMRSTQCVPNAIPPAKLVLQIPPANRVRMVITSMDPFAQLAPQVACSAQTLTLAHRAQLLTIWMEFANNAPLDSSFQATLARIALPHASLASHLPLTAYPAKISTIGTLQTTHAHSVQLLAKPVLLLVLARPVRIIIISTALILPVNLAQLRA